MPKNILNTTSAGALAICAGLALSATTADALTVKFETIGGVNETIEFVDNGSNDDDTALGSIGNFGFDLGNFRIMRFGASVIDTPDESRIQTTQFDYSGGAAGESLIVTTRGNELSGGADFPDDSAISFAFSGTILNGSISSEGSVEPDGGGQIYTGPLAFTSPAGDIGAFSGTYTDETAVSAPFDLQTVMTAGPGNASGVGTSLAVSTISDSEISAIPLPAGGLLLLSALGGFAVLRNHRKAA